MVESKEQGSNALPENKKSNPVFGRKLFFINPNNLIETKFINHLHEEEYETYTISDYKDAKNILRKYPDSICYFYIDSQLSKKGWYNFLESFKNEEVLKTQLIGIITEKMEEKLRDKFMAGLDIKSGLITLDEGADNILSEILEVLETNGAKGRRQFVRATIRQNSASFLLWTTGNRMLKFSLLDISSVGIAVEVPSNAAAAVKAGTLMKGASLKIDSRQFDINAVIYTVKPRSDGNLIAVLLLKGTDGKIKSFIKSYVAKTLQAQLLASIGAVTPDTEDYEQQDEKDR